MSNPVEVLSILGPAFIAGVLVTAALVPFGFECLKRGNRVHRPRGGADRGRGRDFRRFPRLGAARPGGAGFSSCRRAGRGVAAHLDRATLAEVQEAIIGVVFVLGASGAILLLASKPSWGEHLKDLLVGQILWVNPARLPLQALIYAAILTLWLGLGARLGRAGFYALFACAVTFSVQLVGLYLVFASLVLPALATYYALRRRRLKAYSVGLFGYALGLLASLWLDLPSGAMIVCAMVLVALLVAAPGRRSAA